MQAPKESSQRYQIKQGTGLFPEARLLAVVLILREYKFIVGALVLQTLVSMHLISRDLAILECVDH